MAIKQKDWSKAVNDSTKALNSERGNEKALYRRAQASCELEEYDEAERYVKELLEKDENHKEAKALLAKVKRCKVVQEEGRQGVRDVLQARRFVQGRAKG